MAETAQKRLHYIINVVLVLNVLSFIMAKPKAQLFYFRSDGVGPHKADHWFSYIVGAKDNYVMHEWSPAEGNRTSGAGMRSYTVKEFMNRSEFNGRPKIKLGELLRNQ